MRKHFFTTLLIVCMFFVHIHAQKATADSSAIKAQRWQTDSLEGALKTAKEDTAKANLLNELSWRYAFNEPEKGVFYAKQSLQLSQKLNYKKGIATLTIILLGATQIWVISLMLYRQL